MNPGCVETIRTLCPITEPDNKTHEHCQLPVVRMLQLVVDRRMKSFESRDKLKHIGQSQM